MREIKVGFIGAGARARSAHYPCISRLEGVRIEAAAELDEGRLREVVERYRIPHPFLCRSKLDYRRMLEEVELDVVCVVMNETLVTPIAVDCMNAGKHVFIEKPPGASLEDSERLLEAAVSNGVFCMVGYQRRFAAVVRKAIELVRERGGVTLAVGEFHKNLLRSGPGATSTLWNDICHVVDLVRFMTGGEPIEITAYQDRFGAEWRNCYNALIKFSNGAVGIVTGNRASGGRYLRAELHGIGVGCYMMIPDKLEIYMDNKPPELLSGAELAGADEDDLFAYEGTLAMHEHFFECVRKGETPCGDIRDVIHTSRLVDRLERFRRVVIGGS